MYLVKTPYIASWYSPSLVWRIKSGEPVIYITFDDGPDPGVTPEVLDLLDQYNAKATFFCVGEKVKNNGDLYNTILNRGHITGNHTYNHTNGKKTSTSEYIKNVEKAAEYIHSSLFRPPYGRITSSQVKALKDKYKIIMWTVLPGDFEKGISEEKVLKRAVKYTRNGSIIVFHDNIKFRETMLPALKGFLEYFHKKGFRFKALDD